MHTKVMSEPLQSLILGVLLEYALFDETDTLVGQPIGGLEGQAWLGLQSLDLVWAVSQLFQAYEGLPLLWIRQPVLIEVADLEVAKLGGKVPELIAEAIKLFVVLDMRPPTGVFLAVAGTIDEWRRTQLVDIVAGRVVGVLPHGRVLLVADFVVAVR